MIQHIVHYLASAITNLVTFFDIETVVIGGVIVDDIGETLLESMNERVAHLTSGYYVERAQSPSLNQLMDYIINMEEF